MGGGPGMMRGGPGMRGQGGRPPWGPPGGPPPGGGSDDQAEVIRLLLRRSTFRRSIAIEQPVRSTPSHSLGAANRDWLEIERSAAVRLGLAARRFRRERC